MYEEEDSCMRRRIHVTLRLDVGELVTPPWSGWSGGAHTREAPPVLPSPPYMPPFMDAELASAAISIAISAACT
jgi:hypothetical protein